MTLFLLAHDPMDRRVQTTDLIDRTKPLCSKIDMKTSLAEIGTINLCSTSHANWNCASSLKYINAIVVNIMSPTGQTM